MHNSETLNVFSYSIKNSKLVLEGIGERTAEAVFKNKRLLGNEKDGSDIINRIIENSEVHLYVHDSSNKHKKEYEKYNHSPISTVHESKELLQQELLDSYPFLFK